MKSFIKKIMVVVLSVTRGINLLAILRIRLRTELRILAYHRILDVDNYDAYPFDHTLISASLSGFKWQMQYIKQHYTPVSLKQLLDYTQGKAKLPRNAVLVTFDDGFDDNYQNAYPLLQELGIPATFFISTNYINGHNMFWFEKAAYLFSRYESDVIELRGSKYYLGHGIATRRIAYRNLILELVAMPDHERLEFNTTLDEKFTELFANDSDAVKQMSRTMSWEQVSEMAANGMEIGSHSVSHPVLSRLNNTDLQSELKDSKQIIEANTGREISSIAYPIGIESAFNQQVVAATQENGYRLGISYVSGINNIKAMDLFRLKRIHVDNHFDKHMFKALLAVPEIYA